MTTRSYTQPASRAGNAPKWLWSVAAGAAALVFLFANWWEDDCSYWLLLRGFLVTAPFWPEGVHSGAEELLSGFAYYAVFVLGNLLAWTLATRVGLRALLKPRRRECG